MKTRYILGSVPVLLIVAVIYQLYANKKVLNSKNNPAVLSEIAIPVKVAEVEEQQSEVLINKTGNLAPFKEVKVLALTGGIIRKVFFKLGDEVRQGQVLAITDDRMLQLELQKAQSNATKLSGELNTYKELLEGGAATQEKVNQLKQDHADAANQVNQAKKNLADVSILAPTSGTISIKTVEDGLFVSTGSELATITNLSKAKVQVNLTETEVYQVTKGQPVKITTAVYPGKIFKGIISFISPQADQTNNYPVEVMVENAANTILRSGTFVYADFSKKTMQYLMVIPREALTESVKNASVYVVANGVVHLKPIQTGIELGGKIQVISGLKPGEIVVTSGQINLHPGSSVRTSK